MSSEQHNPNKEISTFRSAVYTLCGLIGGIVLIGGFGYISLKAGAKLGEEYARPKSAVFVNDLNGDGKLDLVIQTNVKNEILYSFPNKDGSINYFSREQINSSYKTIEDRLNPKPTEKTNSKK